ncbi:metallophosphoesterase domain-containing protein [Plectosphaerella plurivora]|uniref:Metallophosphoesterase domain-containing protein n=1 Tax=Plectosphaerella plurivora TaxID=936078 RepID=A0A9P8VC76_9PEZI|nr:metallophosphoesterase domain-containing protein [Plectosphaerella plurivora]
MSSLDALIRRDRRRPSTWEKFRSPPVTVVCISDTHNDQPSIPGGDILIHAGDLTQSGTFEELDAALRWLSSQPHPVKIVVAGNHDILLDAKQDIEPRSAAIRASLPWHGITYLQNQDTIVTCPNGRRLHIYGSPLTPRYGNWAFQYPKGQDVWHGTIPQGVDIPITHGPPRGHCDLFNMGCDSLLKELWRVRPRLHVFGHIHEGAGTETAGFDGLQAAFERTVMARGGVWNLAAAVWHFFGAVLKRIFWGKGLGQCVLVNAAMVSGLRDDRRRQAVTVVI